MFLESSAVRMKIKKKRWFRLSLLETHLQRKRDCSAYISLVRILPPCSYPVYLSPSTCLSSSNTQIRLFRRIN